MADTVDRFPAGVPCWIDTTHPDIAAAADFYGPLFGWGFRPAGAGALIAHRDGQDVAGLGGPPGGPDAPGWVTHVRVDDVGAAVGAVRAAGGRVLAEPADVDSAGRVATVADPTGAVLRLWQPGSRRGAGVVNAAGSWNWSNLRTPDPDAARRFYPAVFGWQTVDLDPSGAVAMWLRPGYREVLEHFDPALRDRHADESVPPGFSDAVGWLVRAEPGTPAHWAVTFAVADTDATVEHAVRLGAAVTVAPYSEPPVRAAELLDPQGVAFAVNTYYP
ncbi:MAG TPA: VOC family protein [Pseudonocardia sp.]|nr:VOC family protein [Pseudonocardia sp.]